MYLIGAGVTTDAKTAAHWLTQGAENGSPSAANTLGLLYFRGLGIENDDLTAWQWLLKGAQNNSMQAAFNLGALYQQKLTMRFDDPRSLDFIKAIGNSATLSNFLAAQQKMGVKGFAMNPPNSAALPWYRKAADQGFVPAKLNLGDLYLRGKDVQQNSAEALELFTAASQSKLSGGQASLPALLALINLDMMYRAGWGVSADQDKADKFFKTAQADGVEENELFKSATLLWHGVGTSSCDCTGTFTMGPGDRIWFKIK